MNKQILLEFLAAKTIFNNARDAWIQTSKTANDTEWFIKRETYAKYSKQRYYELLQKTMWDIDNKRDLLTSLYHHQRVVDCVYRWEYETDWYDENIAAKIRPIQDKLASAAKEIQELMSEFGKPYNDAIQPTIDRLQTEAKVARTAYDIAKAVYDEKYEAVVAEIVKDKIYETIKPIVEKFKIKPSYNVEKDGDKIVISPEFEDTVYGYTEDQYDPDCKYNATAAAEDAVGEMEEFISDLGLDCKSTIDEPEIEDFEYHGDEKFPTAASTYYTVVIRFEV